ncbi:hypothetical protein BC827DRAFT_1157928 [Russula dissimulans]|nr:hypothetical protein BC827DRAFT_1157928 [Russula dissimulans]
MTAFHLNIWNNTVVSLFGQGYYYAANPNVSPGLPLHDRAVWGQTQCREREGLSLLRRLSFPSGERCNNGRTYQDVQDNKNNARWIHLTGANRVNITVTQLEQGSIGQIAVAWYTIIMNHFESLVRAEDGTGLRIQLLHKPAEKSSYVRKSQLSGYMYPRLNLKHALATQDACQVTSGSNCPILSSKVELREADIAAIVMITKPPQTPHGQRSGQG